MSCLKPPAMTIEEFINSITMFYIDSELEKHFSDLVDMRSSELQSSLIGIATKEVLKNYIRTDKNALKNITSLLNISEEKFKRIITLLRLERKHMPTTEWSLETIRTQMSEDTTFLDELCELLANGAKLDKYKGKIPEYYLENFRIDNSILGRLASHDDIRRLVKKGFEGQYNNKIGDSFFRNVEKSIKVLCDSHGLTYITKRKIDLVGKTVSITIQNGKEPRILIDVTYGITTSSAQTDYAKVAEEKAEKIRKFNIDKPDNKKIVYINLVDGAGWVARQSDLYKLQRCSMYILNLKTINTINDIINYYL